MENTKELINTQIISEYIESNHLTVKEFCNNCKIGVTTYYKIMNGKNFGFAALLRIARYMKLPFTDFLYKNTRA